MLGLPVLKRIRLQQEASQHVVGHAPLSLRGADSRLFHGAREGPGERPVDALGRPARVEACISAKNFENVRMTVPLGLRGEVYPCPSPSFEPTPRTNARQEDNGLDIGSALLGERFLRLQQPDKLLRLPVRQQEGTVDEKYLAVDLTAPRALVARNCAAPTLDLDQVDLVDRDDEQIDFVDAAVLGDELEIRPGAKWLVARKACLDVVERLAFPRVLGGGDLCPPGRIHRRSITWKGCTASSRLPEPCFRHSIVTTRGGHHPDECTR